MALNLNQLIGMYQQMRSDPVGFISRQFNVPQSMNNPDEILQHLLNSGQVTQSQVNEAMAMRNNPAVRFLMNK